MKIHSVIRETLHPIIPVIKSVSLRITHPAKVIRETTVSDLVVADELNLQWTLDPKVAGNDSDQC